jgi:O-antigen/teichoic acid export membrane protein
LLDIFDLHGFAVRVFSARVPNRNWRIVATRDRQNTLKALSTESHGNSKLNTVVAHKNEPDSAAWEKNLISKRGLTRGFWAIADQAILSLTSLISAVVIGRFAGTEVLGQFTVGFSLAVIFSCIIRALVVGPFAIFVFRVPESDRRPMRSAMWLQCGTMVLSVLGLGIVFSTALGLMNFDNTTVKSSAEVIRLAWGGTLIVTGFMLREVARQANFAELQFTAAFAGDLVASILTVTGLAGLWWTQNLQGSSILG